MSDQNVVTKNSKGTVVLSILALIISFVVIIALGIGLILSFRTMSNMSEKIGNMNERVSKLEEGLVLDKPEFVVSKFDISKDVNVYEYIDDTVTYDGNGLITEKTGNKGSYLVIVKQTLKSGGSGDKGSVEYLLIPVIDGFGEFTTWDYGDVGVIDEPEYQFDIIGNIQVTK